MARKRSRRVQIKTGGNKTGRTKNRAKETKSAKNKEKQRTKWRKGERTNTSSVSSLRFHGETAGAVPLRRVPWPKLLNRFCLAIDRKCSRWSESHVTGRLYDLHFCGHCRSANRSITLGLLTLSPSLTRRGTFETNWKWGKNSPN